MAIKRRRTKGSRKKSSFLRGPATKRGEGLNGCATKEKRTFFFNVREKVPMATKSKPRGGGLKAFMEGPLRKEPFLWLP